MIGKSLIAAFAGAVPAMVLMTAGASAVVTNYPYGYDSFAPGPNSGTDDFGNPWHWSFTHLTKGADRGPGPGFSAWGTPGLGDGEAVYEGALWANDFSIAFVFPRGTGQINETASPFVGGYNEFTRFEANGVAWIPDYTGAGSVTFNAPTGDFLTRGEDFFVNIVFENKTLTGVNTGFSASYSSGVPEPATWAMMLLGFAGLGFAGYRSRRTSTAIA